MQIMTSRVPTAKSRGPVLKQSHHVWSGPGPIATFVRCLRLLDLDLLEDWPGISEQTFSTITVRQNLQTRIKCVEWSLFRLFELWSLSETTNVGCKRTWLEFPPDKLAEASSFLSPSHASTVFEPSCRIVSSPGRSEERWRSRERSLVAEKHAR